MAGPRIGLVLGAGGAVGGAYHAGVITALHQALGWDARTAKLVVGTSAGSVTAALLRAGFPPGDLAARAAGLPLSPEGARLAARAGEWPRPTPPLRDATVQRRERWRGPTAPGALFDAMLRPWAARPGVVAAALLPVGTIPTSGIAAAVDAVLLARWPDQPLWVPAIRLDDGRRVVFGSEGAPEVSPGTAVAASCAIPSYFAPVDVDGHRYVDGGAHSPTNLDLAAAAGLDLVLVSAPMAMAGRRLRLSAEVAPRAFWRAMLEREAALVRRRGTHVVVFAPTGEDRAVMGIDAMDADRRPAVVARARESTLARLDRQDLRRRLEPFGLG